MTGAEAQSGGRGGGPDLSRSLFADVSSAKAGPVGECLSSLPGGGVEVTDDLVSWAGERHRRRSRVGVDCPPSGRVGERRSAGGWVGQLPADGGRGWAQPCEGGRRVRYLGLVGGQRAAAAGENEQDAEGGGPSGPPPW